MNDLSAKIAAIIREHVHAADSPTQNTGGVDKAAEEIVKALAGGEGPTRYDVWNIVKKILDSTHSTGDVANLVFEIYVPYMAELQALRQRVRELERENERLRDVMWQAQFDLDDEENIRFVEKALVKALGHKYVCKWTIDKSAPCSCGGVEAS